MQLFKLPRMNDIVVDPVVLDSFSLACIDVSHLRLSQEPRKWSSRSARRSNPSDTYCFAYTGFIVATIVVRQSIHDHLGRCRRTMSMVALMDNNCIWRGMSHRSVTKQLLPSKNEYWRRRMSSELKRRLANRNELLDWHTTVKFDRKRAVVE